MNIPDVIRIGSNNYTVNRTEKPILIDHKQCTGSIDYMFHEIDLDILSQDKQGIERTFLHEIVHGIIDERNLDVENSNEETIVEEIARGLHQVIRDNPEIFIG